MPSMLTDNRVPGLPTGAVPRGTNVYVVVIVALVLDAEVDAGVLVGVMARGLPGAFTSKLSLCAYAVMPSDGFTNLTTYPGPTFRVTLLTKKLDVESETNWPIEKFPFRRSLSGFTTTIEIGLGSPGSYVQETILGANWTQ